MSIGAIVVQEDPRHGVYTMKDYEDLKLLMEIK
jgi:hypothetical protein